MLVVAVVVVVVAVVVVIIVFVADDAHLSAKDRVMMSKRRRQQVLLRLFFVFKIIFSFNTSGARRKTKARIGKCNSKLFKTTRRCTNPKTRRGVTFTVNNFFDIFLVFRKTASQAKWRYIEMC